MIRSHGPFPWRIGVDLIGVNRDMVHSMRSSLTVELVQRAIVKVEPRAESAVAIFRVLARSWNPGQPSEHSGKDVEVLNL